MPLNKVKLVSKKSANSTIYITLTTYKIYNIIKYKGTNINSLRGYIII